MHRRGHRKSRNGCKECKRRHIKCDETKPRCSHCSIVGRLCEYAGVLHITQEQHRFPLGTPQSLDTETGSSVNTPSTTTDTPLPHHSTSPTSPGALNNPIPTPDDRDVGNDGNYRPVDRERHDIDLDPPVNVNHIELITHFSLATVVPEVEPSLAQAGTNTVLQESLATPCLLYEVLAISSRHLSVVHPDRREFYMSQAVRLQTKAIALFDATQSLDQSCPVAMLLFSSFLNRHCLADALANRDGDFPSFLDRFVQCAKIQKGIRAVAHVTWPLALESELLPVLQWGSLPDDQTTLGHECDEIRRLISITPGLGPVGKEACRAAIHHLQSGFDHLAGPTTGKTPYRMIFNWTIFLPDEFFELLKQGRPEAVALMGWYAVLLHHGRDIWQIQDAGVFLLNGVLEYLGPEWAHWLEWPRALLSDFLAV